MLGRILGSLLVVGSVVVTIYLLSTRNQAVGYLPSALIVDKPSTSHEVEAPAEPVPQGLLHYKNKETRDIQWNADGLPVRITIEREYYQLP
jgi:hypothetical protein